MAQENFAHGAGEIVGDINYVHPFREGNGRTQLTYLKQLADQAGYIFHAKRLDRDNWIKASIEAHNARYEYMSELIHEAIEPHKLTQT